MGARRKRAEWTTPGCRSSRGFSRRSGSRPDDGPDVCRGAGGRAAGGRAIGARPRPQDARARPSDAGGTGATARACDQAKRSRKPAAGCGTATGSEALGKEESVAEGRAREEGRSARSEGPPRRQAKRSLRKDGGSRPLKRSDPGSRSNRVEKQPGREATRRKRTKREGRLKVSRGAPREGGASRLDPLQAASVPACRGARRAAPNRRKIVTSSRVEPEDAIRSAASVSCLRRSLADFS